MMNKIAHFSTTCKFFDEKGQCVIHSFLYLLQSSASFLVCNRQRTFLELTKLNVSTPVPQYPRRTGSSTRHGYQNLWMLKSLI